MNDRTQKKCVLASFGVHSLLCVLLLVGPTFLRSKEVVDDSPILDFIAYRTTDEAIQGGGDPKGAMPAPEPSKPSPLRPKLPDPEVKPPPNTEVKRPEPEVQQRESPATQLVNKDALESIEKKPKFPEVSTKLVTFKNNAAEQKKKADQAAKDEATKQANARRKIGEAITEAANHLGRELSSSTKIELKGPGGGGIPYANFLQAVKSAYANAWILPDGVTDDRATTTATVLIARDGTVVNARIINSSRNSDVDRSVQAALDRVTRVPPLPDTEVKDQREVTINFNVRAKRALG